MSYLPIESFMLLKFDDSRDASRAFVSGNFTGNILCMLYHSLFTFNGQITISSLIRFKYGVHCFLLESEDCVQPLILVKFCFSISIASVCPFHNIYIIFVGLLYSLTKSNYCVSYNFFGFKKKICLF